MASLLFWTMRGLLFVAGIALLVTMWTTLGTAAAEIGAGAPGIGTMALRATRALAIFLVPFSLMALSVVPRFWRYASLPIVWAVVSTILIYPRELDFLF